MSPSPLPPQPFPAHTRSGAAGVRGSWMSIRAPFLAPKCPLEIVSPARGEGRKGGRGRMPTSDRHRSQPDKMEISARRRGGARRESALASGILHLCVLPLKEDLARPPARAGTSQNSTWRTPPSPSPLVCREGVMRLRLASPRKAEKIDSAREREVRPPPPARDAEKGEVRRAGSRGSRTRRIRGGEPSLSFLGRTAGKIAPLHEIPPTSVRSLLHARASAVSRDGASRSSRGYAGLLGIAREGCEEERAKQKQCSFDESMGGRSSCFIRFVLRL